MAKSDLKYESPVRLLLIGDYGVGKTSFLLRFSDNCFTELPMRSIGVDFKRKTIDIDGKSINLQIWDTAPAERFSMIAPCYYKGALGIILVYDCTDERSFDNIRKWNQEIEKYAIFNVSKVLIGNKYDLPEKIISAEQGQMLADELGIQFFETSTKDNINVTETFYYIVKDIKERKICSIVDFNRISLISTKKNDKKSKCCK
ncbi:hypothetical protein SteCoe_18239 [Stentor coeruleus]|uniref:Ras-related protein Rab n=1 Tax=Stentor coeruleus TaxID=5963 RepID=A0A1R2BX40_9CILI|nr:hypothetical protein SteCoe_18239 [Stentor coeruleus]